MRNDLLEQLTTDIKLVSPGLIINSSAYNSLLKALANKITLLINNDFEGLLQLLYIVDISERQVIKLLGSAATDQPTGEMIAGLIIERQLQKVISRRSFTPSGHIPDDEKW